jgi:hypothetical protein
MIRKLSKTFILIVLISLFIAMPVSAAKSYYAERFDVQMDLQENGSAIVTEIVEFHFSGDPFTFAFRDISTANTDGVTFLDASMDGMRMTQGTQSGQVEVKAGNPLKVTWHFPPTTDTTHVFTIRYRADGIIRKDDADTLIWRAIPEDHGYSINRSTITLTYPSRAKLLEPPALNRTFESSSRENRIVLTASGLGEDEDLILTAQFSRDSLTQAVPHWQVQKEQADTATRKVLPIGFMTGIATLFFGGIWLFLYVRANARDLNISSVVANPNPPSELSSAIVGKLTGQQHSFMGTIFELAQRGVLEVREEKGFWGTKNHILVLKDANAPLAPYERGLLDALFKSGETEVNMNEVATRLGTGNKPFDDSLEEYLIQRGWLDLERKQKRTWLSVAGLLILVISMIVFILSIVSIGVSISENLNWLPWIVAVSGISAGLFLLSIPLLVYGATFSILTPAGEEQAIHWKGFAQYLKQVSKGREPTMRPEYFEKYLAYAAVFGLGAGWAKYFQQFGDVPLPVWFHAMAGSDGDFGGMIAVMTASDSAGASASAGGAAGASGGGASGAG